MAGGWTGDIFVTSTVIVFHDRSSRTQGALTRGERELLSLAGDETSCRHLLL